ncbi:MAG TPA: CHRD domain-containing protein [Kiritimatiellia bacterium]|jgi:hypothetical protein
MRSITHCKAWLAGAVLAAMVASSFAGQSSSGLYKALLSGSKEVPAVPSTAYGKLILKFDKGSTSAKYALIVAHIANVTAAHLHVGAVGTNGPVVVTMFDGSLVGPVNGVLANGRLENSELEGPLAGMTLLDLRNAINAGTVYVNVHTTQNPSGEIRGQVK